MAQAEAVQQSAQGQEAAATIDAQPLGSQSQGHGTPLHHSADQ
jgi:hypothetical protein